MFFSDKFENLNKIDNFLEIMFFYNWHTQKHIEYLHNLVIFKVIELIIRVSHKSKSKLT